MHSLVGFYQSFWGTVGDVVSSATLQCLNDSESVQPWNNKRIILILKINNPTHPKYFRHISICNVLYKVVAEVLANRLKKVISNLISCYQNTFVPNRAIVSNVPITHEIVEYLRKKKR